MIQFLVIAAMVFGSPAVANAEGFQGLAAGILALSVTAPKPPGPAPVPAPSNVCDNCNGKGKLGDGTVMVTCPVCNGTGKKTTTAAPAIPIQPAIKQVSKPAAVPKGSSPKYPIRGSWWTGCPDWQHLATGEHRGKFDPTWLKGLSNAELQSLHSDDHEGKVKWDHVVRGAGVPMTVVPAKPATATPTVTKTRTSGGCPGGVCPVQPANAVRRWGVFRW